MPTYYHGTTSLSEKWILEHGLKKSWGNGKEGRFVWMTPDFREAAVYARLRTQCIKMPVGSTEDFIVGPVSDAFGTLRVENHRITKYFGQVDPQEISRFRQQPNRSLPVIDPDVLPIVFKMDLPESWRVTESPTIAGEWRVARNVPPSMLSIIRIEPDDPCHTAIRALLGIRAVRCLLYGA